MSHSTQSLARFVAVILGLFAIACGGDFCKSATATVVEGTVKSSKQVTKGIVEGVKEGRKAGESIDDALIVTNMEELSASGGVEVYSIAPTNGGTAIEVALENKTERPMRVSGMVFTVLDKEGFAKTPFKSEGERTVPPQSKKKIVVEASFDPPEVGKVRLWGQDLAIREGALKPAEAPAPAPDAGAGAK